MSRKLLSARDADDQANWDSQSVSGSRQSIAGIWVNNLAWTGIHTGKVRPSRCFHLYCWPLVVAAPSSHLPPSIKHHKSWHHCFANIFVQWLVCNWIITGRCFLFVLQRWRGEKKTSKLAHGKGTYNLCAALQLQSYYRRSWKVDRIVCMRIVALLCWDCISPLVINNSHG